MKLTRAEQRLIVATAKFDGKEFSGFQIAEAENKGKRWYHMMGYGTLYRALSHLELLGFLKARWETYEDSKYPRRKFYKVVEPLPPEPQQKGRSDAS